MSHHREDLLRTFAMVLLPVTAALNAFLLFAVQPMIGKVMLPLLGGTPAVWNTCVLFFQGALLAGYGYAFWVSGRMSLRWQVYLHVAALLLCAFLLPLSVASARITNVDNPVAWLLATLTLSFGPALVVLSATSPLLQYWLAGSRFATLDPYWLYSASNVGSLGALLAYPVALEPRLSLEAQQLVGRVGLGATALAIAASALLLFGIKSGANIEQPVEPASRPVFDRRRTADSPKWGLAVRWILLAFVPSLLLLGLTSYLTTDVAAVPLLWVGPLALYLLSYAIAFSRWTDKRLDFLLDAQLLGTVVLLAVLYIPFRVRPVLFAPLHMAVFLLICTACHGVLAKLRPAPAELGRFYVCIAIGGALGGIANVVLIPHLTTTPVEYLWALVLSLAVRPNNARSKNVSIALDIALPLAFFGGWLLAHRIQLPQSVSTLRPIIFFTIAACVWALFAHRPLRLALSVAAWLVVSSPTSRSNDDVLFAGRSFYGIYKVLGDGRIHELYSGTTLHGSQDLQPDRRSVPLGYYHQAGPFGTFMNALPDSQKPRRVAVVGLGTGALSCYGREGDEWTFFEIDPLVRRMAEDSTLFTYWKDCPPRKNVVLGDGRIRLDQGVPNSYDMIIVDAFSSDAIPVHLLTKEAFRIFLSSVKPEGTVVFHVSNRYLDLVPVLGAIGRDAKLPLMVGNATSVVKEIGMGFVASQWVVAARSPVIRESIKGTPGWRVVPPFTTQRIWTDSYSDLLGTLRFFR